MGEFHYSRWEDDTWEEELRKMKTGGINIVATYLFWIHHEEKENEWNFSGRRDIRRFVQLCRKVGLQVFLRIGPWVHAEVRNGGFPDWVQRAKDEGYLKAVEKYFNQLGKQLEGLMFKDGGPVIGVQLENEYGHVGGPKDPKIRYAHMKVLYALARKAGFLVPLYTATGWGYEEGMIEETLPVLGGYVDAPWDTTTTPMPASSNFLFIPYRNDASIGTNRSQSMEAINEKLKQYPFLTAELGTGLQVSSHRRPYASAQDIESNVVCMLGSGANLLGYYMYHGGINVEGQYTTLNEEQRIGGYTTLPIKSYGTGFLFINNHQRLRSMKKHDNEAIRILWQGKRYELRIGTVLEDTVYVYQFRLGKEEGLLEAAPGNILCRLGKRMVIYGDNQETEEIPLRQTDTYIYLGRGTADRTARFCDGLYITGHKDSIILEYEDHKELITSQEEETVHVLSPDGKSLMRRFVVEPVYVEAVFKEIATASDPEGKLLYREYIIEIDPACREKKVHNLYLQIIYEGDRAEIYEDGKLLDDWYTTGADWFVNIRRFGYPSELVLRIYDSLNTIPCTFGQEVYYELPVRKGCLLKYISMVPEYNIRL